MTRKEDDVSKKLFQITLDRLKAQGLHVDYKTVESICKSKWEFIAYIIRFGQSESYRDKYFGNFGVKRWRLPTKQYRFLSLEDKAYCDSIENSLDRLKWLEKKYYEYRESKKLEENKLYFPVIMTDKKGKETEFLTLKDAAEFTKLEPLHIYIACVKNTFTKRGLKFRFTISLTERNKNEYKNKKRSSDKPE